MTSRKLHIGSITLPLAWMTLATVEYGNRGSGKTTLAAVVAEEVYKTGHRFCAIDLKGDWWGLKASADGQKEGIPVVIFGGDHADLPLIPSQGKRIAEIVAKLDQSVILDLENVKASEQLFFLADFFEWLYHYNRDPLLLILDEAQSYIPQKPVSKGASRCKDAAEALVKLGRKHGINPFLITQRGASVSKDVTELCDMLIACRSPGVTDQDRILSWFGGSFGKKARETLMEPDEKGDPLLARLDKGEAIFASAHPDLKLFELVKVRRRETFDSSATPEVGKPRKKPKKLAAPDLAKLKETMAETIAQEKENDVGELKKEIAQLQKQLTALADREPEQKIVEVPVIKPSELKRIEKLVEKCANTTEALTGVRNLLTQVLQRSGKIVGHVSVPPGTPTITQAPLPPRRPVPQGAIMDSTKNGLPQGERKILECLLAEGSASKRVIGILTGYTRNTRRLYLGALHVKGLITDGDPIEPTEKALEVIREVPARLRGNELASAVQQRLPQGEWRILQALLDRPEGLTRDEIERATGYTRNTRRLYLGALSVKGFIDMRDDTAKAHPIFFE